MREFSGHPSGAEGGGAGPGSPPLDPTPPSQPCSSIHPIEVAPEARLEPPATGTKPRKRGNLSTACVSLTSWNSCQSTGLGPCPLQKKLLRWMKSFKVCMLPKNEKKRRNLE